MATAAAQPSTFRAPRCTELPENNVTITDFAKWQSCLHFNLCSYTAYAPFLEANVTWSKASVTNRGLISDATDAPGGQTAVQKNAVLTQMLGIIAQYAPSLLRNDIIKKSTSLNWIWNRVRRHYGFQQSEQNFLNICKIKREEGERYETLYQRLVSHIDDNLLTTGCSITHDGDAITADEELSPTCERLTVYLWLCLIDHRLPAYVARVHANDLLTKSLKDLQPQICLAMDSLLAGLNSQDDVVDVNYGRSSSNSNNQWTLRQKQRNTPQRSFQQSSSQQRAASKQKQCSWCKNAGRTHIGHDISTCWFISKFDRMEMTRTLQVSITSEDEQEYEQLDSTSDVNAVSI